MSRRPSDPRGPAFELVRRFGTDAVSFLTLQSAMGRWFDGPSEGNAHAVVAFSDTSKAWIAAGSPVADASRIPRVARSFVDSARANGRRACFFASESPGIEGFGRLLLGEQPVWAPAAWLATLATHPRLREQIRRPKAKGVTVRRVNVDELEPGTTVRQQVDALAGEWLRSRRMPPMGFLVALDPFQFSGEHRYFVAEWRGRVVEFLSAVPVYARDGWLVQDVLRGPRAPNGTTEAVMDALLRDVADSAFVTLGLSPLSGAVAPWLRIARFASSPLFDFEGLRAFRQRLRPARWESVWLLYPRSEWAPVLVFESLRAFAGGSVLRFALRCIIRAPSGPPWALALPLVPWTLLLAVLVLVGRSDLVGFSPGALTAWVAFDALLTAQLLRSALRARPARLAICAAAAIVDAGISVPHLVAGGLGGTLVPQLLRCVAAFAPCVASAVLVGISARQLLRSEA